MIRPPQRSGRFQRHVELDLAIVLAGIFQRRHLERPRHRAEIGNDDLPVVDRGVEEGAAHQRVGGLVLEDAGARKRGALYAGPAQKLAPAPGAVRVGCLHRLGVEGDPLRAQPRNAHISPAIVDLQEKILALLRHHGVILSHRKQCPGGHRQVHRSRAESLRHRAKQHLRHIASGLVIAADLGALVQQADQRTAGEIKRCIVQERRHPGGDDLSGSAATFAGAGLEADQVLLATIARCRPVAAVDLDETQIRRSCASVPAPTVA